MSEILKKGIDVSKYQGAIDWPKVKASGVDFAFIRSTFGWDNDAQLDPCCNANMWGCEAAGIPYGLYHYSYAQCREDAVKEARFFLRMTTDAKPSYPVAFDFEEAFQIGGGGKAGYRLDRQLEISDGFMETLESAGYYGVLYSTASALTRLYRYAPDRIKKYDIWVANVGVDKPAFPGVYGIWQYSWKGKVNGIVGDVDLNYAYRDYPAIIKAAGLNGWSKPAEIPQEPGTPDIDWKSCALEWERLANEASEERDNARAELSDRDAKIITATERARAVLDALS